jgi:hypothetical protein
MEARRRFVGFFFECPIAVVVTVTTVVDTVPSLASVTWGGLKVQVVSAGNPEQEKLVTAPLNPLEPYKEIVAFCDWPAVTVTPPVYITKSRMLMYTMVVDAG